MKKQIAKQSASSQLGGGAEVDGFNKTLTSLEINISPKLMIYVVLFMYSSYNFFTNIFVKKFKEKSKRIVNWHKIAINIYNL